MAAGRRATRTTGREYRPMRATPASRVPAGGRWLHEAWLDGFRVLATLEGGEARLRAGSGFDVSARFAALAQELPASLRAAACVLDGMACALDLDGVPRRELLLEPGAPVVLYLFDL